ncbi:MAG: ferrous iron transport protein A [Flavobacteriales bacterium]|nr:ferrous iron transport protein A [Flavobacteriales bacterium]
MRTLDQLKQKECGTILSIVDNQLALQLISMGFVIGEKITVDRIAPLNDPIIISCGSNCVCIRKKEATLITVDDE